MQKHRSHYWLAGLLVVGILALSVPMQEAVHRARPLVFDPNRKVRRTSAITAGPTPAVIAALGGFRTVAADMLWLKLERLWDGGAWWALPTMFDTVTQLDPHFLLAWQVYGWHCAYNLHAESETVVDKRYWLAKGVEVLERAVEANPTSWEIYKEIGWTLYDRAHEPWRAADYFWEASQFPDAPATVTRMYYRCFEHVMDFDRLFPALEYAKSKHLEPTFGFGEDINLHQKIVKRDLQWWAEHRDDPKEHRRQIVLENTARKQRSVPYYLYPDDPYWDVCERCGLPSPKGSETCQVCGNPFPPRAQTAPSNP
jgi:hypothetical protein